MRNYNVEDEEEEALERFTVYITPEDVIGILGDNKLDGGYPHEYSDPKV